MKKLKFFFSGKQTNKGQSFMEMTVVLGVLLFLLMGMVETAYLLNQYIELVDGAREGARYGSSGTVDPYIRTTSPYTENIAFREAIDCVMEGSQGLCSTPATGNGVLDPIVLNPDTDELIITFYRVVNGQINQTFGPWKRYNSDHDPQIEASDVFNSLDPAAPDSGVLVIEIFYAHHQLVNFPIYSSLGPIPVHTYSIMPLSRARPTPEPP